MDKQRKSEFYRMEYYNKQGWSWNGDDPMSLIEEFANYKAEDLCKWVHPSDIYSEKEQWLKFGRQHPEWDERIYAPSTYKDLEDSLLWYFVYNHEDDYEIWLYWEIRNNLIAKHHLAEFPHPESY